RVHVRRILDAELEPNNSLAAARLLGQGIYNELSLDDADPSDVLRFEVAAPERDFEVRLDAQAKLNLRLYRLDQGGWVPLGRPSDQITRDTLVFQNLPVGSYALEILPSEPQALSKAGLSYGLSVTTLQPALYVPFA